MAILMNIRPGKVAIPAAIVADVLLYMEGQSNDVGYAKISDLTDLYSGVSPSLTRVFDRVKMWHPVEAAFIPFCVDTMFQDGTYQPNVGGECMDQKGWEGFGAEVAFAQRWEAENTGVLYIVKRGRGATSISFHLSGGTEYTAFTDRANAALAWLSTNAVIPTERHYLWDQGESNHEQGVSYATDLAQLRSEKEADGFLTSSSIMAIVKKNMTGNPQQLYVDSVTNARLYDATAYPKLDADHYNAEGQLRSGSDAFNAIFNKTGSVL